ncbi:phosphoribosylglycinamide synthetase [Parasphingorhabdus sp.]|uniref:D-alanine--D-alanine ligase family protein n=1 Tax=Parasphingorhabdus sp. TaxID=2709688 RepID=UPI003264C87D
MTPNTSPTPQNIPEQAKEQLKFLFLAKHALWKGGLHPEDGNHAIYHHEVRKSLENLGLNLSIADNLESLFEHPKVDLVFPILNRCGFVNSEMMVPLLSNMHGIPYVGAGPIMRGIGDDKAMSKMLASHVGVPTAPWFCYRRGAPINESDCPKADRWVIKPNASSASWAISDAYSWSDVSRRITELHEEGHDVIVEPYLDGLDVQAAFLSVDGPKALPMLIYEREDTQTLWTYDQKRDLIASNEKASLQLLEQSDLATKIGVMASKIAREFDPFDYGRIEFRLNRDTGEVNFIEINLNCNLWSEKVVAKSAHMAGFSHEQLLETILHEALRRNHLIPGNI